MARYVIDASAAFEYLLQTPRGSIVAARIEGEELLAPEIMDAEVLSALRTWALTGQIDEARALAVLDDLANWSVTRLPLLPLVKIAWRYRHNVSAYDAFYVAAAVDREARVITTDGRLSRAPGLGIDVIHIQLP